MLVTHKDYIVEMVTLIIKEMDLDPCGEHSSEDLGASSLYDLTRVCPFYSHYTSKIFYSDFNHHALFQALVCIKALQDRCMTNEGVIWRFRKPQEIENKEGAQYSEAIYTLNQELTAKTKVLTEETHRLEEAEKAKTNLATKLAALHEQMEKARADVMAKFRISQPFFNACGVYYGDGFEDCLKQVKAAYPNLDLS